MFKFNSHSRAFRIILGWAALLIIFAAIAFIAEKRETGIPVFTILGWFGFGVLILFIYALIEKYVRKNSVDKEAGYDTEEQEETPKYKFFKMVYMLVFSHSHEPMLREFGLFKAIGIILALVIIIYFVIIFTLKTFS